MGAATLPDAVDLALVRSWIEAAERIVVLTGAGISTESGIPDFRGPNGLWTRNPAAEKASDIRYYLADPEVRRAAWQARLRNAAHKVEPNGGHRALVRLAATGKLLLLVTQNIDGLHQQAGSDPAQVVEVHGTTARTVCLSCGDRRPMAEALDRVRAGEEEPACLVCGGILKSDTISFGQPLVAADLARAEAAGQACDLLIAVGTTLSVYPIAALPRIAKSAGARVVTVNGEPTDYDHRADAVLRGSITPTLDALIP
jgi:NAD-dependent deacetylase